MAYFVQICAPGGSYSGIVEDAVLLGPVAYPGIFFGVRGGYARIFFGGGGGFNKFS
jgi:hypothetical protein